MSTRWFPDLWSNLENQSLKEKTSCTVWMSPYLNLLICKYLLTYWRSRINSFLLLLLTTPNRMVTWASDWLTSITRGKQFYDLFWNKTWFFQSKLVVFMCLKSFWPKPVCVQLWDVSDLKMLHLAKSSCLFQLYEMLVKVSKSEHSGCKTHWNFMLFDLASRPD